MIALSIFTVGIMAVGAMLVYSTRARVLNRQINNAISLTHERVEEIRKVATLEEDIRFNTVLNFNYILSRDPAYGTVEGYAAPGLLSGAAGYTVAANSINTHGISAAEKQKRRDSIKILYDDGNMALHGDEAAGDGIWSCLEYINMDTGEVRPQPEFAALTRAEKSKWRWILTRRTVLEPVVLNTVAGSDSKRTIAHVTLPASITDTTGADVIRLMVESTWVDMTGKKRTVSFNTLIARSTM